MTDKLTTLLSSAGKSAQGLTQSDDFKKALPYLLSGGTAAVAGGALTGKRRKEESRLGHLGRVLTNASLAGGAGAAATYGLKEGYKQITSGGDKASKAIEEAAPTGPLGSLAEAAAFHPATAVASGAAGLGLTGRFKGIGDGRQDASNAIAQLQERKGNSLSENKLLSRSVGVGNQLDSEGSRKLRRQAGIPSSAINKDPIPGLSKLMQFKPLNDAKRKLQAIGLGRDRKKINAHNTALKRTEALKSVEADVASRGGKFKPKEVLNTAGVKGQERRAVTRLLNQTNSKGVPDPVRKTLESLKAEREARAQKVKGPASAITRRGMSTFGQTPLRRMGRGGLGLIAAGLPALVGAIATDDK